jgi:hypothetical protein
MAGGTGTAQWLHLDAELLPAAVALASPGSAQTWLARNAALPAGCKLVLLMDGAGRLVLRTEVWAAPAAAATAADVELADLYTAAVTTLTDDGAIVPATDDAADALAAVAEQLAETEWSFAAHAEGGFTIGLDLADVYALAVAVPLRGGGVRVRAALAMPTPMAAMACRHAVAVHLLRASGAVRLVRAVRVDDADDWAFEIVLGPPVRAAALAHACAALTVAMRGAAREAAVLGEHADLARAYLALHHVAPLAVEVDTSPEPPAIA